MPKSISDTSNRTFKATAIQSYEYRVNINFNDFSSNECRVHASLLQKSEKLKESHDSFCGTKYPGIDRVLVTPVQDLVESSARNCSNAKNQN